VRRKAGEGGSRTLTAGMGIWLYTAARPAVVPVYRLAARVL
jgi:hypothetical protein